MARGQSTEIISMIKWAQTSRLSIKNSPSIGAANVAEDILLELMGRSIDAAL
jgi:hypothetical protein